MNEKQIKLILEALKISDAIKTYEDLKLAVEEVGNKKNELIKLIDSIYQNTNNPTKERLCSQLTSDIEGNFYHNIKEAKRYLTYQKRLEELFESDQKFKIKLPNNISEEKQNYFFNFLDYAFNILKDSSVEKVYSLKGSSEIYVVLKRGGSSSTRIPKVREGINLIPELIKNKSVENQLKKYNLKMIYTTDGYSPTMGLKRYND
jgi:hypothetical protein